MTDRQAWGDTEMNQEQLEPTAGIMTEAYQDTYAQNRIFRDEYGYTLTTAAKAHYLRSIVQAQMRASERYELGEDWSELGRVEFTDREHGRSYLLRSDSAVKIEQARAQQNLFHPNLYLKDGLLLVVYSFSREGLSLSLAGTKHRKHSRRIEISGEPTFVGTWTYTTDAAGFDQEQPDQFTDLGNLDMDDEGEAGGTE